MPANLTPEYRNAEANYRRASNPPERLDCLKEMLRTIPKHKGTDHLQAEIKTRIKNLTEELAAPKRGGRRGPSHVVRPEGAAQIALLGPPNSGKSALHAALTGSHAETGPYPFTTRAPLPGMLPFEDIHLQLVDLPPISKQHPLPWIVNALQPTDACLLVIDLENPDCLELVQELMEILAERGITMTPQWKHGADHDEEIDPFGIVLPTLVVATRADEIENIEQEIDAFFELLDLRFPALPVSNETREGLEASEGLEALGRWLFERLEIVRVYTKTPGKPPAHDRPFTVRRGGTVRDVARLVHKDLSRDIRYARIWGGETFSGQQVGPDHVVADGDVVEIHT
ncbi:MAG: TGS domain-containing protein [Pseudomonadales bacterium]